MSNRPPTSTRRIALWIGRPRSRGVTVVEEKPESTSRTASAGSAGGGASGVRGVWNMDWMSWKAFHVGPCASRQVSPGTCLECAASSEIART